MLLPLIFIKLIPLRKDILVQQSIIMEEVKEELNELDNNIEKPSTIKS
jgi:hypothetical protein